jgi:hypothetical protein
MQVERNNKIIMKAFNGLRNNKHQHLVSGLKGILNDAVLFIYEQHRVDGHENHIEYGDTYGWALYYKGQMLEKKINVGPQISDMSVSEELESRIAASTGYVGIIMAGMDPRTFFFENHETKYLENAMAMIAAEFPRFFQK